MNYNKDVWAARGTFEMGGYGQPVLMRITGDYTKDNGDARGGHRLIAGQLSGAPVLDDVFDTRGGLADPKQYVKSYGLSMNITAELSDAVTLRSISAWRKDDSASPIDFDALPAVDVDVPAFYFNEQLTRNSSFFMTAARCMACLASTIWMPRPIPRSTCGCSRPLLA